MQVVRENAAPADNFDSGTSERLERRIVNEAAQLHARQGVTMSVEQHVLTCRRQGLRF